MRGERKSMLVEELKQKMKAKADKLKSNVTDKIRYKAIGNLVRKKKVKTLCWMLKNA